MNPWWIINGELLRERHVGMQSRHPERHLVPFARRQDNDDVVCFDLDEGRIVIVPDYAPPGWEQQEKVFFQTFDVWFRHAVEDLLAFE